MSNADKQTPEHASSNCYCRTVFYVEAVPSSVDYYQNRLGFREMWRHDTAAARVERDGLELILYQDPQKAGNGLVFLSLDKGESLELAEEFKANGVRVDEAHWGMKILLVSDDVGNLLYFTDDEVVNS